MQQKLVTIYLDNGGYKSGKMFLTGFGDMHGHIEEHLQNYLNDGWRIQTLAAMGGSTESVYARGWLAVVLQK